MQRKISVFDTTLRDGEQMPGVNMNIGEKLRIAYNLERLGVDIIEAGFPAASQNDMRAVEKIAENISGSAIAALARADKADIDAAVKALQKAKSGLLHIFIATSDIHLKHKLGKTREQLLDTVREAETSSFPRRTPAGATRISLLKYSKPRLNAARDLSAFPIPSAIPCRMNSAPW